MPTPSPFPPLFLSFNSSTFLAFHISEFFSVVAHLRKPPNQFILIHMKTLSPSKPNSNWRHHLQPPSNSICPLSSKTSPPPPNFIWKFKTFLSMGGTRRKVERERGYWEILVKKKKEDGEEKDFLSTALSYPTAPPNPPVSGSQLFPLQ